MIERQIQAAVEKAVDAKTVQLTKELTEAKRTMMVVADRYDFAEKRAQFERHSGYGLAADALRETKQ